MFQFVTRCIVILCFSIYVTNAILFGSEGGCGSFGCKTGGCRSACEPPPPCASPPPPPPLPCDSCGRRKREAGVMISKEAQRTCSHDKLQEIMKKSFHSKPETTILNLNATLHHSDKFLIVCAEKGENMTVVVKMDHYCTHEDNKTICYVFGTGLRAKEV
ncbi:hypothetical protein L596_015794 [Steinernema carpocapsae]|uniref:Ground-like domain-containing protein n=1 Tax=Steinernema carpocapsae TaxID=34508 RepID=A0A4U5NH10_STECR|nr:hypothetical protein L596_015794 [Steinernema carpocapsae]